LSNLDLAHSNLDLNIIQKDAEILSGLKAIAESERKLNKADTSDLGGIEMAPIRLLGLVDNKDVQTPRKENDFL
jgi:hypothetical protein